MLKMIVAHSEEVRTDDVANDLFLQIEEQMPHPPVQAGLLFSAVSQDNARLLERIEQRYPDIELIGCTTNGEISNPLGFREDSTVLALFAAEGIEFAAGVGYKLASDPNAAVAAAVRQAASKMTTQPKLAFITPESLGTNAQAIRNAIRRELGEDFPFIGGISADQWQFEETFQFYKSKMAQDAFPILLVGGDSLLYSTAIQSGWRPIGRHGRVTGVSGNRLQTIDHQPAINFFHRYLGPHISPSNEYPLAVFERQSSDEYYLRAPMVYHAEDGSVTFPAEIPKHSRVRLTEATRASIIEASAQSVRTAIRNFPGKRIDAAVCVSCAARKQVLGTKSLEEANVISRAVGAAVPFCGFYAYGEYGPFQRNQSSYFHNETFVTLLLGAA